MKIGEIEALRQWASNPFADNLKMRTQVVAVLDYLAEVERERDEARAEVERLKDYWNETGACLREAQADLATLRAAVDEAVRRADGEGAQSFFPSMMAYITEPLRNLTKPDTPSERIMSDKDRENPVEGAHPTQPEGEEK